MPAKYGEAALLAQHRGREAERRRAGSSSATASSGTNGTRIWTTASGRPGSSSCRRRRSTACRIPWTTGSVYDPGTATHHLTLYRAKSGALVFGAGMRAVHRGGSTTSTTTRPPSRATAPIPTRTASQSISTGRRRRCSRRRSTCLPTWAFSRRTCSRTWCRRRRPPTRRAPTSKIASPAGRQRVAATDDDHRHGDRRRRRSGRGGRGLGGWRQDLACRATGTDRWTYEWSVPAGSGTVTIMSRAVDDSANVEMPAKGLQFSYTSSTRP